MPRKKGEKAPALTALPFHFLILVRLHCTKTEDTFGADEAYITANGRMVWGIVDMNDGDTRDLDGVVEPIRFRNSVSVELWDNDTGIFDSDDRLGTNIITYDPATVDQELQVKFTDDDANYQLTYIVTN